jgi:ELP3 family radical SAM enzyme/protein acetyltransferase
MDLTHHLQRYLNSSSIEEMGSRRNYDISEQDTQKYYELTRQLYQAWTTMETETSFNRLIRPIVKNLKTNAKKTQIRAVYLKSYQQIHPDTPDEPNLDFVEFLLAKPSRGESGVETVTILTSPYPVYHRANPKTGKYEQVEQRFSCQHDCHYCPKETALVKDPTTNQEKRIEVMPRSYLTDEPACRRAAANKFDCCEQIYSRLDAIRACGHPTDKIEMIWLGGTLTEYPQEYVTEFARDMYYACNTFPARYSRERLTLAEELQRNVEARCRVIGLTIETRPDAFSRQSKTRASRTAYFLRSIGTTRIQMGVQHTNDYVLKKVNRGCYLKDTQEAIRLVKNLGFKTIIHLMPDLPFSSPEMDKQMLRQAITDSTLQSDEIKVYPTATTQHTQILKWQQQGLYQPYAEDSLETLIEVILDFMRRVPPWIRLPRVVRDIPDGYIEAGIKCGNLRQVLDQRLQAEGQPCRCIRSREIRSNIVHPNDVVWDIYRYQASGGTEYFISRASRDGSYLLGFIRLRLSRKSGRDLDGEVVFSELVDSALIRELHVYGRTQSKSRDIHLPGNQKVEGVQHRGMGQALVQKAKEIAWAHGYQKIAVTSGVGVRSYYLKKCGFTMLPGELYPNQPLYWTYSGLLMRIKFNLETSSPFIWILLIILVSALLMSYCSLFS